MSVGAQPSPRPQERCRDLVAAELDVVGSVCVSARDATLDVAIEMSSGFRLLESRVAAAGTLAGFPLSESGMPRLGEYPYSSVHRPTAASARYEVALGDAELGAGLVLVSVHGSVLAEAGTEHGAWARGTRFRQPGSPATYFEVPLSGNEPR